MKKILTLGVFVLASMAGFSQTSVQPVQCGNNSYFLRVVFTDSIIPVHDIDTLTCLDGSVHTDTEEGQFLACRMELYADAACTHPVAVDPRFFEFVRDRPGSSGTRNFPTVFYQTDCAATVPAGSVSYYNYRIDYPIIYFEDCIWQCDGAGFYNCYQSGPGQPVNYNIALNCCFAPSLLAVHLVDFTGNRVAGQNELRWTLDNLQDFVRLELERSFDGIHFEVVYASGSATVTQYAETLDATAYYRLSIYSAGGLISHSAVLLLKAATPGRNLFVFPSPFDQVLNVKVTGTALLPTRFRLFSSSGILVFGASRIARPGVNLFSFFLPGLPPGVYMLQMEDSTGILCEKIIKGR